MGFQRRSPGRTHEAAGSFGAVDRAVDRAVDVVGAAVLLVPALPLMAAIGAAILLTDGRPVLFRQQRCGRGGRPFRLCKFRTLPADGSVASGIISRSDRRVSRLGRWLRRTHLDELPQLFHVLTGSMALVGPRPETPEHLASVPAELLAQVQRYRPGLTGPTQLAFVAEDATLAETEAPELLYATVVVPAKVQHDLGWLPHRTLARDLAILLRTPFVVLSRGARARSRAAVQALLRDAPRGPGGSVSGRRDAPPRSCGTAPDCGGPAT